MEMTDDAGTKMSGKRDECSGNGPVLIVSYTEKKGFKFSCTDVQMNKAGVIIVVQDSDTADWTFIDILGLPAPEFEWKLMGRRTLIFVRDARTTTHNYNFTITIRDAHGKPVNSGDRQPIVRPPMIMNL